MSQAEKCFKCYKVPDDILMLACGHDLCLGCAAQVYCGRNPSTKKVGNPCLLQDFICDLCNTATDLDASSVYELEKIHI
jgi:hypothetical protein